MRAALLAVAAPLSVLAGCYAVDFDDEADAVFACIEDVDCRDGFVCLNALCLDDRGPALTVLGPESLSAFDAGTDTVEISFRGSDLTLSNNFETAVDGEGYLEIYLDGQPVRSKDAGTAITEGDLAGGISVGALDIPDPSVVNHRVEVRAFRGDGTRYDNPSATGRQVFFVRSDALIMAASRPMMAVTRPWPGDRIKVGAPITVEIAAVDFTWADPTGEAGPGDLKEGHAHLFLGRDDYPACLPGCNGLYTATMTPGTEGTADARVLLSESVEYGGDVSEGAFSVSAGLQRNNHAPWPAEDPVGSDLLLDQVVTDTVVVELVP